MKKHLRHSKNLANFPLLLVCRCIPWVVGSHHHNYLVRL